MEDLNPIQTNSFIVSPVVLDETTPEDTTPPPAGASTPNYLLWIALAVGVWYVTKK